MNRYKYLLNSTLSSYSSAWKKTSSINRSLPPVLTSPSFREKGHSKWQNIRHIKGEKDLQRSQVFGKLVWQMKLAVGDGSPVDPKLNSKLAAVVDNARRHNMPTATIEANLKRLKEKPLTAVWYELRGPEGAVIYMATFASSQPHVRQTIKKWISKVKCSRLEIIDKGGLVKNAFDHKGVILAEPPPNMKNIEETSLDHAIEVGAEEVAPAEEDPKLLEFITPVSGLQIVRAKLEELKYNIKDAQVVYIPKQIIELSEEEKAKLDSFLDHLAEMPEVAEIHTNF